MQNFLRDFQFLQKPQTVKRAFEKYANKYAVHYHAVKAMEISRFNEFTDRDLNEQTLVIVISKSGIGSRVIEVLERVNALNMTSMVITDSIDSKAVELAKYYCKPSHSLKEIAVIVPTEKLRDENWKEEFKTTVPFYVLASKDKGAITNFEKKIRKIENYNVLKTSLAISFIQLSLFFILSNFYDVKNLRTYFFIFIIFPVLTIVYNYIFNSFAYKEKFKEIRFSVYHWRIFLIFSLGYFGLQYIKPFDEVISNLYQNKLDFETITKLIVFIILVIGFNYTGVAQFKFAKTMKKVKPFLKYL